MNTILDLGFWVERPLGNLIQNPKSIIGASMGTGFILLQIYVFALACFAGMQLIGKVPSILHTPLTSASNAISGITVMGCIVMSTVHWGDEPTFAVIFATITGMIASIFAQINVVGGFAVTERMLLMFKKKE
jgi:NAD(P) transhydrogenase subunit alpha